MASNYHLYLMKECKRRGISLDGLADGKWLRAMLDPRNREIFDMAKKRATSRALWDCYKSRKQQLGSQ